MDRFIPHRLVINDSRDVRPTHFAPILEMSKIYPGSVMAYKAEQTRYIPHTVRDILSLHNNAWEQRGTNETGDG